MKRVWILGAFLSFTTLALTYYVAPPALFPAAHPVPAPTVAFGQARVRAADGTRPAPDDADRSLSALESLTRAEPASLLPDGTAAAETRPPTEEEKERLRDEWEAYYKYRLRKDPTARSYVSYAQFLFDEKRYTDVKETLKRCLALPNCQTQAKILLDGLDRVQSATDPLEVTSIALDVELAVLNAAMPPGGEPLPVDKADVENAKVAVANKVEGPLPEAFLVSPPPEEGIYVPSEVERKRLLLVQYYEADAERALAGDGYTKLVAEYPESPLIQLEFARFLLRGGKRDDALAAIGRMEQRFPSFKDEPEWKILTAALHQGAGKADWEIESKIAEQLHEARNRGPTLPYFEPMYPLPEAASELAKLAE